MSRPDPPEVRCTAAGRRTAPASAPAGGRSALVASASQWDYADVSENVKRCHGALLPAVWKNSYQPRLEVIPANVPSTGTRGRPAPSGFSGKA